jgi:hypothetical protein
MSDGTSAGDSHSDRANKGGRRRQGRDCFIVIMAAVGTDSRGEEAKGCRYPMKFFLMPSCHDMVYISIERQGRGHASESWR